MLFCLHFGTQKLCFVNAASGKKETEWMYKIKVKSRDCWQLFITVLVVNARYFWRRHQTKNVKYTTSTNKHGSDRSSNLIFHIKASQINVMYGTFLYTFFKCCRAKSNFEISVSNGRFLCACFTALPGFSHTSHLKFACEHFPAWMLRGADHLSVGQLGGWNWLYMQFKHAALTIICCFVCFHLK